MTTALALFSLVMAFATYQRAEVRGDRRASTAAWYLGLASFVVLVLSVFVN